MDLPAPSKRRRTSRSRKDAEQFATLAKDALEMFAKVIQNVTGRMKDRLEKEGKTETEAEEISKRFSVMWKENLSDMQIFDHRYFAGMEHKVDARTGGRRKRRIMEPRELPSPSPNE
eukprot:TRINITY_DN1931_c0_g1_i1.p1 TRINITY_DN1931_c0_g1~~TRINITY_DN1931_c0_g1_i1.p1  ORF type:complete len:117 (+),score=18.30 TRINITY_DN1931_c0_g1_i1:122-472(+)